MIKFYVADNSQLSIYCGDISGILWIVLMAVIAEGPIQPMVLMSPTSLQSAIVSPPNTAPVRSASNLHHTQFGDVGSNGPATALSPLSLTHKPSVLVGLAAVSPSVRREQLAVVSPSAGDVLTSEAPPVPAPKLRDQVRGVGVAARFNVGENAASQNSYDDDVYNYPRQDFQRDAYKPPMPDVYHGAYQQDDETYDTPPMLRQRADPRQYDDDDTYDLPPKAYRDEAAENDEIYDVPPIGLTNVASGCKPPANHGTAWHHSYVNTASLVTVAAVRSSDVKHVHRLTAESDVSDTADDYGIAVSSRTRSFKSSNSQ